MRITYISNIVLIWLGSSMPVAHSQWLGMPDGPNEHVRVLCFDSLNDRLYAFGRFLEAGGQVVNGTTYLNDGQWHPMGNGVDNVFAWSVIAAHLHQDSVMISGSFQTLIGVPNTQRVALWNGTQWQSIGGVGADQGIWGMLANEDGWTLASAFTEIGGIASHGIARYRNGAWEDLCLYPDNEGYKVYTAIAKYQGQYIFGGNINGDFPELNEIGVLVNDSLRPMGTGILGDSWVNDMVVYDGKLFVAGEFYAGWGNPGSGIITWDGESWVNPVPGVQFIAQVHDLDVFDGKLFIGGRSILPNSADFYTLAMYTPGQVCLFGKNLTAAMNAIAGVPDGLYVAPNYPDLVVGGVPLGFLAHYDLTQGFDTCLALPVGIDHLTRGAPGIMLHPNPSNGRCQVRVPEGFQVNAVTVHDALGREAKRGPFSFDPNLPGFELTLYNAAPGFYTVRVCGAGADCLIGRMVIH